MQPLSRHTLEDQSLPMFGNQWRGVDVTRGNPFRAGLQGLGCASCSGDYKPPNVMVPVTSARLGALGYQDDLQTPGTPSQGVTDFLSVFNGISNGINRAFTTITGQSANEHAQENAVALAAYQAAQAQALAAGQAAQAQASAMAYWPLALGGAAVLGVAVLLLRK